uniref:Uncharacterized protein n=1 Tax=Glossina pallidipes TaxID=7398 RepID=A0A1A9ZZ90_GLOPL
MQEQGPYGWKYHALRVTYFNSAVAYIPVRFYNIASASVVVAVALVVAAVVVVVVVENIVSGVEKQQEFALYTRSCCQLNHNIKEQILLHAMRRTTTRKKKNLNTVNAQIDTVL